MRLAGRWHQIFGAHDGALLSTGGDCSAFGLETDEGLVLFDAGTGLDAADQPRALAAAGFPEGPRHLLLTHGHADHAGGAALLVARYRTTLHAPPLTAQWLAAADEAKISLSVARRAGIYPPDYVLRPATADRIVAAGAAFHIGGAGILPVATPGHSADHFSYLVRSDGHSVLVGGDALFAGGTIVLQDTWDSSVSDSCATIRRLATLAFESFLPGHGPAVLGDAPSHLALAMARVDRLLPPLNFL
jgi:glyoxylase-like metal-dependent hydrolase (beta-lactamase superfamily II)